MPEGVNPYQVQRIAFPLKYQLKERFPMFLFQKIIGPLFFPVTIVFLLLVFGLLFLILSRKKRIGMVFILIGVFLLGMLSYEPVAESLLKPLEGSYMPLVNPGNLEDVRWIVILGGGHTSDRRLSVTSRLSDLSLFRLIEGIRLHRELPKTKLILSGGRVFDPVSEARGMAEVAFALGVEKENLVLEEASKDTSEQARFMLGMIKQERFILVTSAAHMPRAMVLFRKLGLHPIPAPTDYQVKEGRGMPPKRFYPTADGLMKSQRAFYEYSALAWTRIKDMTQRFVGFSAN
jgi:uncharacterized SAM-binding protein YcdF (DUF218 family)